MFGTALFHPSPWHEHNVKKARKFFFAYGSIGVYQGAISPYHVTLWYRHVSYQFSSMGARISPSVTVHWRLWTELCKRAFRLLKWYSNTTSMIAMDCQLAEACCLTRKFCFLCWITDSSDTLSSRTLVDLSNDIKSVCLIRECLELEEHLNTNFMHPLLISSSNPESDEDRPSTRQIKDQIARNDKSLLLEKCRKKEDTRLIAEIMRMVSW